MTCSCNCAGTATQFDRKHALQDRARYERKGPDPSTGLILEELRPLARTGDTLLDIGGGIGVLDLVLHRSIGLREAVLVEAAPDSVAVARELWDQSAEPARLRAIVGDFAQIPFRVTAEIVTLDRVVCCYPDFSTLLRTAAASATRVLALSYPRDRWYIRLVFLFENLMRRITRNPFRTFVHPPEGIRQVLESAGLRRTGQRSTLLWLVESWRRTGVDSLTGGRSAS
jgi:magnesium-protoporphyrin O-methyltransferase